jgi:hypothetical protein
MGQVTRQECNISGSERNVFSLNLHYTSIGVTDSDLHMIMEMKVLTLHIRDFPALPAEQQNRKVYGQAVMAVFNDRFFRFGHVRLLLFVGL